MIREVLAKKDFAFRGDYTEMLKLALILLTGELPEGFNLAQPGAVSKARWMSKFIYSCKLVVLRYKIFKELGVRIMTHAQADLIERFVKWACLVWVKWWIRCPLVAEAGLVDLEQLHDIRSYPDPTIARATERSLHLHLWYLTQELSPLALFSS